MDAWREVAREIGGSYIEAKGAHPSIRRRAGGWEIVLQQGTLTGHDGKEVNSATFLTAPVDNSAGLEFTLYREGVVESLSKRFGSQDVQTGDEKFDRAFFCKSNDEKRLRELFSNAPLKALMLAVPDPVLTLSCLRPDKLDTALRGLMHRFLPGMAADMEADIRDKLQCYCKGILSDAGAIKSLFQLFELLLPRLEQLEIARPVRLR